MRTDYRPGLVSVIIPAYNAAPYIVQAVESVLAQTYSEIECIVVDDGSQDDTYAQLEPQMHHITYLGQKNQGPGAARNLGIEASRGEFIAFLDADDWWAKSKIEKQVCLLRKHPTAALAYTWMRQVDELGIPIGLWRDNQTTGLLPQSVAFEQLLQQPLTGAGSTLIVTRWACEEMGTFDPNCGSEDWEFPLRLSTRYSIVCLAEPLAYYRRMSRDLSWIGSLERYERHHRLEANLYVLNRIFSILPDSKEICAKKRSTYARKIWYGALISYGLQNVATARQRALQAWKWDSQYFKSTPSPSVEELLNRAEDLVQHVEEEYQKLEDARIFINYVLSNLPQELQCLRQKYNQITSSLNVRALFKAYQKGNWNAACHLFWRVLRQDRSWLRNKGFIKVGVLACLRRRYRK